MCSRDGLFSAESGKWTRSCVMLARKYFQDHLLITSSFTTVSLLLFSLLFAYVSHHTCLVLAATPPHYLTLPISLNSLDRECVRLLSRRDSQILPNRCRCRWWQCRGRYWTQVGVRRGFRTLLHFLSRRSVVEPSWGDRGSYAFGVVFILVP